MLVYIPNEIYKICKFKNETMGQFIKNVLHEWTEEFITADNEIENSEIEKNIKLITIIEEKFVFDN